MNFTWEFVLAVYVTLLVSFLVWDMSSMSPDTLGWIKEEFRGEKKGCYRPKVLRAHSWWCRSFRTGLVFGINALASFSVFRHGHLPQWPFWTMLLVEVLGVVIFIDFIGRRYEKDLDQCRQIRDSRPKDLSGPIERAKWLSLPNATEEPWDEIRC